MKERQEGLVSVVIPCYNAAPFIVDCLDGLKSQKYKKMEVILVNDASTDNTSKKLKTGWKIPTPFSGYCM